MKQWFLCLIRFYQKTAWFHKPVFKALFLSDRVCRFTPTCSQYCYEAVDKYGIIKGLWLGLKRIIKCHPWSKGGRDSVPKL